MERLTFRQIEHYFYHYRDYVKELESIRAESLDGYQRARSDTTGGSSSGKVPPGAPFEDRVVKDVERIAALEFLTGSIDKLYQSLDTEKQKIFRLKYLCGYSNGRVIRETPISRSGFYAKRVEIVEAYFEMVKDAAKKFGLLDC